MQFREVSQQVMILEKMASQTLQEMDCIPITILIMLQMAHLKKCGHVKIEKHAFTLLPLTLITGIYLG